MRVSLLELVHAAAIVVVLAGTTFATTITFTGHEANSDVTDIDEGAYGSRVVEETTDFITSDGTGATPNIALIWQTATGPNIDVWEFHNAYTFFPLDPELTGDPPRPTGVAQLDVNNQNGVPPADPTITFVPDAGYAVTLHSFNMGHATDLEPREGINAWTITLTRDSDEKVVWKHTTKPFERGATEEIKVGYTGEPGERYTLRFDRQGANHPRAGIDNLSFSQTKVEPLTEEQIAAKRKSLAAKIEQLHKAISQAKEQKKQSAQNVAEATTTHDQASDDDRADAGRQLAKAKAEAKRASKYLSELTTELEEAERQYAKLQGKKVEEKPTHRPAPIPVERLE